MVLNSITYSLAEGRVVVAGWPRMSVGSGLFRFIKRIIICLRSTSAGRGHIEMSCDELPVIFDDWEEDNRNGILKKRRIQLDISLVCVISLELYLIIFYIHSG